MTLFSLLSLSLSLLLSLLSPLSPRSPLSPTVWTADRDEHARELATQQQDFNENSFSDEHLQIRRAMMAKSELQKETTDKGASKALQDLSLIDLTEPDPKHHGAAMRNNRLAAPPLDRLHRRYRAIVGALGWLNQGTRPDISHAYFERSKFVRELNGLWGWVDAEFAADLDTSRSHTGYVIMMNGGPISLKSVKQKSVSLRTAESEWNAASEAGKELLYLCIIMREFGFPQLGPSHL